MVDMTGYCDDWLSCLLFICHKKKEDIRVKSLLVYALPFLNRYS